MSAIFGHVFAIFRCLRCPLVAKLLHILVEQVISFEMSTQRSKSDKNCLQKYAKSDRTTLNMLNMLKLKTSPNHSKSLILESNKIVQKHFLCTFSGFLVTIICDVKTDINICEPHYVNFFVNLLHSPRV